MRAENYRDARRKLDTIMGTVTVFPLFVRRTTTWWCLIPDKDILSLIMAEFCLICDVYRVRNPG
jgi:hypothetical protein